MMTSKSVNGLGVEASSSIPEIDHFRLLSNVGFLGQRWTRTLGVLGQTEIRFRRGVSWQ